MVHGWDFGRCTATGLRERVHLWVLRSVNGDGNLYMQNGVNGANVNFWHTPLRLGVWNEFVVHVHLEKDLTGWVELWYDGQQQTSINGKTRYYGSTWDNLSGSYNLFKWGGLSLQYPQRER
jgi:hypothetical protein